MCVCVCVCVFSRVIIVSLFAFSFWEAGTLYSNFLDRPLYP